VLVENFARLGATLFERSCPESCLGVGAKLARAENCGIVLFDSTIFRNDVVAFATTG
jgi:hypothetical protein